MQKYFPMYHDYRQHLALLSHEEIGRLLLALLDYSDQGILPKLGGSANMAFSFIKAQIDRDHQKYLQKCEQNRENAAKRWEPDANAYDRILQDAIHANTKTKKKTRTNTKTNLPLLSPKGDRPTEQAENVTVQIAGGAEQSVNHSKTLVDSRFPEFWEKYPKKAGKGAAEKAWKHLNPNADLFGRMMEALGRAMVCDQWNQDGGRFIPNPATWLNQRRWEDEPEVVIPRSNPRRTYDLEAYEEMDFRNTRPFWD